MAVLDRVLSDYPSGPIVVSTVDLAARLDLWVKQWSGAQRLEAKGNDSDNAPVRENVKTHYVAPATRTERIIVEIWQDCLGIAPIGIRDDFFALGGNSLLATQVLVRIRKKIQTRIGIHRLVENPTVDGIALAIMQAQVAEQDPDLISALLEQVMASREDQSELS